MIHVFRFEHSDLDKHFNDLYNSRELYEITRMLASLNLRCQRSRVLNLQLRYVTTFNVIKRSKQLIKEYLSFKVYDGHLNTIFQAAITILRIDDLIKLEPEKGEEKSYQQAYADGSLEG